ncbi:hypothetical protein SK128_013434, partial [Halocaridina rubra]
MKDAALAHVAIFSCGFEGCGITAAGIGYIDEFGTATAVSDNIADATGFVAALDFLTVYAESTD